MCWTEGALVEEWSMSTGVHMTTHMQTPALIMHLPQCQGIRYSPSVVPNLENVGKLE